MIDVGAVTESTVREPQVFKKISLQMLVFKKISLLVQNFFTKNCSTFKFSTFDKNDLNGSDTSIVTKANKVRGHKNKLNFCIKNWYCTLHIMRNLKNSVSMAKQIDLQGQQQ